MNGRLILAMMLTATAYANAATFTVCKSGDCNFTSIQAAINVASIQNEIIIKDAAIYDEQVTIDSTKSGLILRSENPQSAARPTIRYKDITNVHPTTFAESQNPATINYCRNGALRIVSAAGVRIEGLIIDGGGAEPFAYPEVWGGANPLFHGNAALAMSTAGDCIIRDCEFKNAYFGIYCYERNTGGVFANPDPTNPDASNIIPYSAFARVGNHLFEYNRIHNNTWGLYFESMWDMGSTIRYNLIYNNHHANDTVAARIAAMPGGKEQAGGALLLKDVPLTPLAIHNNTFWHNYLNIARLQSVGAQHLIFNNIFGAPYRSLADDPNFPDPPAAFDRFFVYRMHSCVYGRPAASTGATGSPLDPFPESANVRWLDIPFKSTDPASADFLVPDWSAPLVQHFIVNQGWMESGVRNPDGSRADLGAIPSGGDRRADIVTVRPTRPVTTHGDTVLINFNATPRLEKMNVSDVRISYLYAVINLDSTTVFDNTNQAVPAANIRKIPIPATKITIGENRIRIPLNLNDIEYYSFFEMILEATGTDGKPFSTSVGFVPCRRMEYLLNITVLDATTKVPTTQIRAGTPCILNATATYNGKPFTNIIDPTEIYLQSRFDILNPGGSRITSFPVGISGVSDLDMVFTRIPSGDVDYVHVAGRWINGDRVIAFLGSSQGVEIRSGPADSITFQKPASGMMDVVSPGTTEIIKIRAYDKYGNPVDTPTTIRCETTSPENARILVNEAQTDNDGIATFHLLIASEISSNGAIGIIATLPSNNKHDTAYVKTGLPRPAVLPPALPIYKPHPLLCELIDLRGKVLRRETIDARNLTRGKHPFSATTSRGMYILRVTDLGSGVVRQEQRLLISR